MRTTQPDQDPMTAMVQVMLSGKCTDEQFRTARRAVVMAEYGRMTDAELEALVAPSPWLKKLTDAELEAIIDAELDGLIDADAWLAIVANNKTLTDNDRAKIAAGDTEA